MEKNPYKDVNTVKKQVLSFFPAEDQLFIETAIAIAQGFYGDKKRLNGDPEILHALATAHKTAEMGLGPKTVSAAILHDVLKKEETKDQLQKEISEKLGNNVEKLVEDITSMKNSEAEQSGKFTDLLSAHKYLLSSVTDLRVIMIKLAEKYHNLLTIDAHDKEKKEKFLDEMERLYIPLSEYLGLGSIHAQLEDLLLAKKEPEIYKEIYNFIEKQRKITNKTKDKILDEIKTLCEIENINDIEIQGRTKSASSIYKKQRKYEERGKKFQLDNILDILAFRFIVKTVDQCYEVKSSLTSLYENIPEEEDDYISNPKPNGYKSIHLCVRHPQEGIIEVQIRTRSMHFYNEFGPASHVAYKKSHQKDSSPTDQFQWIKEVHKSGIVEDEPIKAKLFKDQIFAFTPDKDIVQLPKGSTPLDFAYKVHTRVGNQCIGALVNGKATALDTEIKTGDIVDIRTDKNKQYASEDWVNMVHTEAAKRKIKSSLAHKRRSLL